jgi:hypothetical protein
MVPVEHASMPTVHGSSFAKNPSTFDRGSRFFTTAPVKTQTAWTWNTLFAMSKPTVIG